MANKNQVKVVAGDFVSLGQKLERLHSSLSSGERQIFEFLMESAAAATGQSPPPWWITPHFKYRPRGAKSLVIGGADGLTVLITGRGKVIIIRPGGPVDPERLSGALAAIPIRGSLRGLA